MKRFTLFFGVILFAGIIEAQGATNGDTPAPPPPPPPPEQWHWGMHRMEMNTGRPPRWIFDWMRDREWLKRHFTGRPPFLENFTGRPPFDHPPFEGSSRPPALRWMESFKEWVMNRMEGHTGRPPIMENFSGRPPRFMENFTGRPPRFFETFTGRPPRFMENFTGHPPRFMENFSGRPPVWMGFIRQWLDFHREGQQPAVAIPKPRWIEEADGWIEKLTNERMMRSGRPQFDHHRRTTVATPKTN